MELVLASNNPGKLKEIRAILAPMDIQVVSAAELGFTEEVEETGQTFAENALLKARTVSAALDRPALADDSGLTVDALDGAPGVYSARYAGPNASDKDNYTKLLEVMAQVPTESRNAAFMCVMACVRPHGAEITSQGRFAGVIAPAPVGQGGFGYDPVFLIPGDGRTVAQLEPGEKNAISHRARALEELVKLLPGFLTQ